MNILKSVAVFFLGLFLLSASCKKTNVENILPPATQNGSNTMGALVNNAVWNPIAIGNGSGIIADYQGFLFNILAFSENAVRTGGTSINITLSNFNGIGTYNLNNAQSASGNSGSVTIGVVGVFTEYNTDNSHNGNLIITNWDAAKRIISGTFQFDAVNQNNSADVIHVTSGRFDFSYPLNTVN